MPAPSVSPGAPVSPPGGKTAAPTRSVVLWLLGALLVGLPILSLPSNGAWMGLKALALEVVGILLAVYVVSSGEWTWTRARAALLAAPNLAILLFLLWIGISVARPDVHPLFKRLSYYEGMRYLGGALIYFAVLYGLSPRRHLVPLLWCLLAAATAGSLVAFTTYGEGLSHSVSGAFQNGQMLAGFLCLVLPLVVMTALRAEDAPLRTAGQVVTVIVGAGVLVSQNRSVWIGTAVALLVLTGLYLGFGRKGGFRLQKHELLLPVLVVALVAALAFFLPRATDNQKASKLSVAAISRDESFQWRLGMWSKALRMTAARPLMGWGIGTFPVQQAMYYHPAVPEFRNQKTILATRPSLAENAHNTYLQLAAEMGLVGLGLYLAVLGAFLFTGFRVVGTMRRGLRQGILIGALAAIPAQMVSAVGSPAYEFPEVSLFFWLVLGIGMSLAGVGERGRDAAPERTRGT